MWGYEEELSRLASKILAIQYDVPFSKFGIFAAVSKFYCAFEKWIEPESLYPIQFSLFFLRNYNWLSEPKKKKKI